MGKKLLFYVSVLGLFLAVDLITKRLWFSPIHDLLNNGGVFGWGNGQIWGVILLGVWLVVIHQWWAANDPLQWWGLALVVSGGLGNLLDRWWYGGVRDFIYYPYLGLWGNVADIFLGIGSGLLLISYLRRKEKHVET